MDKYFLMNKDKVVAEIVARKESDYSPTEYAIDKTIGRLPYMRGNNIEAWIDNRKASKHNRHLHALMVQCGCGTTEGYLRFTHAATLNDTFWIKKEDESVSWNQVSLYRNEFNEVISKLAFEGGGLYGLQFSSTSPELTTDGSFRKCWKREDDGIYLYKRGRSDASNAGLEPYSEVLASEVAIQLCGEQAVPYTLAKIHGNYASRCKLFTSEEYGYVPFYYFANFSKELTLLDALKSYSNIGSEDLFRRMMVLDAITLNTDRHPGNFGFLVNNETLEPATMAPVFDLNLAMLPYESVENIRDFGRTAFTYTPAFGEDFVKDAKELLTPDIRADLINMDGFQFSMSAYPNFPAERIEVLGNIVNTNIRAILGKEKMYLMEVYPHIETEEEKQAKDAEKQLELCDDIGNQLMANGAAIDFDTLYKEQSKEYILNVVLERDKDASVALVFRDNFRKHDFYENDRKLEYTGLDCRAMQLERKYDDVIKEVARLAGKHREKDISR